LQAFQSLFLTEGIDSIAGPDGTAYHIFDLISLYNSRVVYLSPQRSKAVELLFYRDMTEHQAAAVMGLSSVAPVSSYAKQGARLLAAVWDGMVASAV
jgi:hypothetical protein